MGNRLTTAARTAVTGKTPADRRDELQEEERRVFDVQREASARVMAVLQQLRPLAEELTQARVEEMRNGDRARLDAALELRQRLVGNYDGGSLAELAPLVAGMLMDDRNLHAGGQLGAARLELDIAKDAHRQLRADMLALYDENYAWFLHEVEGKVQAYLDCLRLAESALTDADALRTALVNGQVGPVAAVRKRAGHSYATLEVGRLDGARDELRRAIEGTDLTVTGLNES